MRAPPVLSLPTSGREDVSSFECVPTSSREQRCRMNSWPRTAYAPACGLRHPMCCSRTRNELQHPPCPGRGRRLSGLLRRAHAHGGGAGEAACFFARRGGGWRQNARAHDRTSGGGRRWAACGAPSCDDERGGGRRTLRTWHARTNGAAARAACHCCPESLHACRQRCMCSSLSRIPCAGGPSPSAGGTPRRGSSGREHCVRAASFGQTPETVCNESSENVHRGRVGALLRGRKRERLPTASCALPARPFGAAVDCRTRRILVARDSRPGCNRKDGARRRNPTSANSALRTLCVKRCAHAGGHSRATIICIALQRVLYVLQARRAEYFAVDSICRASNGSAAC